MRRPRQEMTHHLLSLDKQLGHNRALMTGSHTTEDLLRREGMDPRTLKGAAKGHPKVSITSHSRRATTTPCVVSGLPVNKAEAAQVLGLNKAGRKAQALGLVVRGDP